MKEITSLLQKLAEKLGTTVQYLWGVLIKQAYWNSIENIFLYILIIPVGVIIYKILKKLSEEEDLETDRGDILAGVLIFFGSIFVLQILHFFFTMSSTITGFANPEYWALHHILDQINN